jgi:hypothetical protein
MHYELKSYINKKATDTKLIFFEEMLFGTDFDYADPDNNVTMNTSYTIKDKLTLFLLGAAVLCFGVVFPDSLSNHIKLVHFAAHFGMSFLLALSAYLVCTVKLNISKSLSYSILIAATLFIGVVYKFWEIATQGVIGNVPFQIIMDRSGVMTSMSQNLSGLAGAILLIESLLERNLIISAIRSGNFHIVPSNLHFPHMGNMTGKMQGGGLPAGSQFSPEASEK